MESQFVNSTRKLVDSDEEQIALEELIDRAKPPVPADAAGLHYLLYTPFRFPPLPHGSRFGRASERGIFYAAREIETCLAEVAYYRLVFLAGTAARLPLIVTQHTAFRADVRTAAGVDLTRAPFDAHRERIASPVRYADSQALGAAMRRDGVEVALYPSARAREGGTGVAVLAPAAFASPQPFELQGWTCTTDPGKVEIKRQDLLAPRTFVFSREEFLVDGVLPAPAVG